MKDQRIPLLRRALDAVLDSLDATLRMREWSGPEEVPEPLRASAARLIERLGSAVRLSAISVRGDIDARRVEAMTTAVKRLDSAYVAFREAIDRAPTSMEAALAKLRQEVDLVKEDNEGWAAR